MNPFEFCPHGHKVIHVPTSLLWSECYYCADCDKIYQPVLEDVDVDRMIPGRFKKLRDFALILEARHKVTKEDLISLGLMTE